MRWGGKLRISLGSGRTIFFTKRAMVDLGKTFSVLQSKGNTVQNDILYLTKHNYNTTAAFSSYTIKTINTYTKTKTPEDVSALRAGYIGQFIGSYPIASDKSSRAKNDSETNPGQVYVRINRKLY